MNIKINKHMLSVFAFFTLIFAFAGGEDVSWIGILINSFQYGLIMTLIIYFLRKTLTIIKWFIFKAIKPKSF